MDVWLMQVGRWEKERAREREGEGGGEAENEVAGINWSSPSFFCHSAFVSAHGPSPSSSSSLFPPLSLPLSLSFSLCHQPLLPPLSLWRANQIVTWHYGPLYLGWMTGLLLVAKLLRYNVANKTESCMKCASKCKCSVSSSLYLLRVISLASRQNGTR